MATAKANTPPNPNPIPNPACGPFFIISPAAPNTSEFIINRIPNPPNKIDLNRLEGRFLLLSESLVSVFSDEVVSESTFPLLAHQFLTQDEMTLLPIARISDANINKTKIIICFLIPIEARKFEIGSIIESLDKSIPGPNKTKGNPRFPNPLLRNSLIFSSHLLLLVLESSGLSPSAFFNMKSPPIFFFFWNFSGRLFLTPFSSRMDLSRSNKS